MPDKPSCLDAAMIEAIEAHAESLRELSISLDKCDRVVDVAMFEVLLRVLPNLTCLKFALLVIRVPNGILRERGYSLAEVGGEGWRYWNMKEYLAPGMSNPDDNTCICIRDEKRKPTGSTWISTISSRGKDEATYLSQLRPQ
jgi:hypothetical protein